MAKNKIIYGGTVLVDMTTDTATAAQILDGYTAHINTGEQVEGTCTYDADTSDATAQRAEILLSKTAYVNGTKLTGSMPNNGAVSGTISTKAGTYTVPIGYHDGSGTVGISSTEQAKIIASNIKSGVKILGVTGSYSGEGATAQAKTATPSTASQVILPDEGYDYLSQVTVAAIPYVETANAYGTTVTIG
jgi:hypothetical protein